MMKKINRYLVFTSFVYRIAVFLVMPVLLVGIGVFAGHHLGELWAVPVALLLTMAEIISDYWLFSGLQAKDAEKMDFMKTSGLGMEVLRDALILDLLRRFLTACLVMAVCNLLTGRSGSAMYAVLVSYACSVLGVFLARFGGIFRINLMVGYLAVIPVSCLLGLSFFAWKPYMFRLNLLFFVLGILLSVLAVKKALRKVKGGYYDQ